MKRKGWLTPPRSIAPGGRNGAETMHRSGCGCSLTFEAKLSECRAELARVDVSGLVLVKELEGLANLHGWRKTYQ
eukprot:scaffold71316_cov25-Tisochrysis_lutea.AAC.3